MRAQGRLLSGLSPDEAALLFGALLRAFTTKIMRAVVVRWSVGVWLATSTNPVGDNFFFELGQKTFSMCTWGLPSARARKKQSTERRSHAPGVGLGANRAFGLISTPPGVDFDPQTDKALGR